MQNTFKKPSHWIKGFFLWFLQTRADILEFRAKFSSIVQAFLKHCFRTSKLFRIWIALIPSFLFMSKTNTGTCTRTTPTLHLHHISAVKSDSACTQEQNLPLHSSLEVLLENRNKVRYSNRGKSVVMPPTKHPIDI